MKKNNADCAQTIPDFNELFAKLNTLHLSLTHLQINYAR